ncbi:MAG: GNAT family N-acetyltransferase [Bacteroidales bacterium]|nr:GNAT family N-acetyltransferase [Bacteroidales bacterium]
MIGTHISLRAPEPADIDTLYKWENDPTIWHLGNTLSPYSRFEIEQFVLNSSHDIYSSKQLRFMIDCLDSSTKQETVGSVDLFDFDPHHRRAGIGILIDEKYRKNGFATEALELLSAYCFNTLNLHQLYCNIENTNQDSIRLFTRLGYKTCGLRKQWLLRNQEWTDELMLQLINPNESISKTIQRSLL